MKIKELMESTLFDENEQVVILHGDVNNPIRPYTGRISNIPTELQELKIEQVAAMGEHRRNIWNLNHYGWLEIWVETTSLKFNEEDFNMDRVDNIVKFAQKKEEEQIKKEMDTIKQIETYKEIIKSFKSRIDKLIMVGNACLRYNIPLEGKAWGGHEGYDTNQFITNSWSHLLGFVSVRNPETRKQMPFTKLGIMGGGACNFNLETDGVIVEVSGKEILWVLKKFVEKFDEFETEFYKYVDKVTS